VAGPLAAAAIRPGTYPAAGARGTTTAVFTSVFACPLMSTLMMLAHSDGGIPMKSPSTVVVVYPWSYEQTA